MAELNQEGSAPAAYNTKKYILVECSALKKIHLRTVERSGMQCSTVVLKGSQTDMNVGGHTNVVQCIAMYCV